MFAPPALVSAALAMSPKLRDLPAATRRRILEAGAAAGPGWYRVVGVTSVLNVRDVASLQGRVNGTVKNGELGLSDGTEDNGYIFVQFDSGPIGWASAAYLAPDGAAVPVPVATAPSGGGAAPAGSDLTPGEYVVATQVDPLNLRASPSTAAAIVATMPKGDHVIASGMNANNFAQVQHGQHTGWAASAYLVPASQVVATAGGDLVLTGADLLQLRALLAAWSHGTTGAPEYGSAADLELTAPAMARQGEVLAAFQSWWNANRNGNLRTDGIVDAATRDALTAWGAQAVGGGAATPADPNAPPSIATTTPNTGGGVGSPAKAGGALVLLALLAAGAFFLVEQKKKRGAGGTAAA